MSGALAMKPIPARDTELEPWCCICGSINDVRWCNFCKHYFCVNHRKGWGVWDRGKAGLKQWLMNNIPAACPGARSHAGR